MSASPDDPEDALLRVRRLFGPWIRGRVRARFSTEWEDVEQEVLLKLGQALPRMREETPEALRALVSRTVRSVCIDEIRRRVRRRHDTEAPDDLADDGAAVPETAARKEDLEIVKHEAWTGLSEQQRRILTLRFDRGLSFRQIAQVLDVPQGSVAGWYSRALASLREVLS